jgi:transposase
MYVESVPNRNSPPAVLLRESRRENGKTVKRTLANLSDWPETKIESLRRLLRDELLVDPRALFQTHQTLPHGHVEAVLMMIRRLGLDSILASQPSRERDLVTAMIAECILHPCSKLATVRDWHTTTLAEQLSVQDASEDELYQAMDWLLERKQRIEKKLAARHLREGSFVLYDVSSSYYEGHSCPLAKFGYGRDGKKGLPIIVYGVITDPQGRPLAVEVYPGNTADPSTVMDQADKLVDQFGLSQVVFVADRGMLTQPQIDKLKSHAGFGWITALTSVAIRELVASHCLQLSLLDETNLAEINSPEYPGERLMVCRNPLLAEQRTRKRLELLESTEKLLDKISKQVARRSQKPLGAAEIGLKVGKVLGRYKMAKHFDCSIENGTFRWSRREESIQKEASLDGIYVIRTSEPAERLSREDTVRNYKSLAQVERAFRSLKSIDLMVRPIRHRTEDRVKAHIFLCMLAYYVEWHMLQAWAPLLFADQELPELRKLRDPILPASISESAKDKKATHRTQDGLPVHSFSSLMDDLATRVRVTYGLKTDASSPTFQQVPEPSKLQQKAYQLLAAYPVSRN